MRDDKQKTEEKIGIDEKKDGKKEGEGQKGKNDKERGIMAKVMYASER